MSDSEICFMTATELALRIRARNLSAVELMRAHLDQIDRVNPVVNAIVTLLPEQALEHASASRQDHPQRCQSPPRLSGAVR